MLERLSTDLYAHMHIGPWFIELQNALHLFEQQTHSQFYMKDA